ncbi:MAG: hypothetical protein JRN63_03090 [Nitrososphaerota archaeon]|nr:hypothetical protein [Nitrososphaerota archaeon]
MKITQRNAISASATVAIVVVILVIAAVAAYFVVTSKPSTTTTTSSTSSTSSTSISTTSSTSTSSVVSLYGPPNASQLVDESTGTAPDSFDPGYAFYSQDTGYINAVFQNLLEYNGTSGTQLEPVIADNYTITNGGYTNVFHIRPGVTFSDGTPVTGYDQWFSIVRTQWINAPSGISASNWNGVSYNDSAGYSFSTFGNQFPYGLRAAIHAATGLQTTANTTAAENLAVAALNQMLSNFNPANSTQDAIMSYPHQAYVANATYFTANYINNLGPFGPQLWAGFDGQQVIEPAYVDAHGGVANNTASSYLNTHGAIGTGPYEIRSISAGGNPYVLQAYPGYWGAHVSNVPNMAKPASIPVIIVNYYSSDAVAEKDFGTNVAQISAESPFNYNAMYQAFAEKAHFTFNQIFQANGKYDFALFLEMNMWTAPTNYTSFRLGMANALNYTEMNEPGVCVGCPAPLNGVNLDGYQVGPTTSNYLDWNLPGYPNPTQNTTAAYNYFQEFGMQSHTYMVVPSTFVLSNGTSIAGGTVIGDASGTQLQPFKLYYAVPALASTQVFLTAIHDSLAPFGIQAVPFGTTTSELDILDGNKYTYPAVQSIGWGADFNDPFLGMFFPLMTPSPYNGYFTNSTVNSEALKCEFPATTAIATACATTLEKMAYQNQIFIYTPIPINPPQLASSSVPAGTPTNYFFVQPYVKGLADNQFVGYFYNQIYYQPVQI